MNEHKPVMLREVLYCLAPTSDKYFLDCTFGRGGHSKEILKYSRVHALDRDPQAFYSGMALQSLTNRFTMDWSLFSESLYYCQNKRFDGILFDFGLSSPQILDMSFSIDSPLRMVMGKNKINAYDVVNSAPQSLLETIIREFGEEQKANLIARNIINRRRKKPIETTVQLAHTIHEVAPRRGKDPATQTFQAIRMYVNNELDEITQGLINAVQLSKPGGIIVTITFHSLEDRIVKNFFKQFRLKSKAIMPTQAEIYRNRRARSAKLRWARVI